MVDQISSQQSFNELQAQQLQPQQQVEQTRDGANGNKNTGNTPLGENVELSEDAIKLYEAEKEASRFAALARKSEAPFDREKVGQIKNLLDSGRINEYLNKLDYNDLADTLLNSPVQNALL